MRMQKFEKPSQFEVTVSPHLQSAYNLARWLTHNEMDAEDVMQESFVRALRGLAGFDGDRPFRPGATPELVPIRPVANARSIAVPGNYRPACSAIAL